MATPTSDATSDSLSGRRIGSIAVAVALVLVLWPELSAPLDGSFDSAWRWAAAYTQAHGRSPGLIPQGPLGAWIEPRVVAGGTLTAATIYLLAIRLLWGVALIGLAREHAMPGRWGGVAALLIGGRLVGGHWPDYEVTLLTLALALPWSLARSGGRRRLALAAGLAGLSPFLKLSCGAATLGVLVSALAVGIAARRPDARRTAGLTLAAAGAAAGLSALLAFPSLGLLVEWVRAVPRVLGGYGLSQALELGRAATVAAWSPLLLCVPAALFAFLRRSPARALWVAAALPLAAALKHALVRPDVHALAATAMATGALGLAVLVAGSRTEARLAFLLGAALPFVVAPHAARYRPLDPAAMVRLAGGVDGLRHALDTFTPAARHQGLTRASARALAPLRDPALAELRDSEGGVDVQPWKLGVLPANGLERAWRPSPGFQLQRATSAALEQLEVDHFAGPRAPRWLLVHFDPFDGRQPLWEAPRVWSVVAERYEIRERPRALLQLERRARPARWRERELGTAGLEWSVWTALPDAREDERIFVRFDLRPTLAGRWRRALLRAEPIWVETRGEERRRRWRLLPGLTGEALEIGAPPRGLSDLAEWLDGAPRRSVRQLRLLSADAGRYAPVRARFSARRLVAD